MPPSGSTRRALRRRLAGGPLDARWWYWIAAVPATAGLWALAVAWTSLALRLGPLAEPAPLARAVEISMVAFGPPFLALQVVLPAAVHADATAVRDAGLQWAPAGTPMTLAAAAGPAVAGGGVLVGLATGGGLGTALWSVGVGFLLSTTVAVGYLRRRHRHLGTP